MGKGNMLRLFDKGILFGSLLVFKLGIREMGVGEDGILGLVLRVGIYKEGFISYWIICF